MLKAVRRRVRGFMLVEVLTELAELRAEILALREEIARADAAIGVIGVLQAAHVDDEV
jgi:hypothetical protein